MFILASEFNSDLSNWDVSRVEAMNVRENYLLDDARCMPFCILRGGSVEVNVISLLPVHLGDVFT